MSDELRDRVVLITGATGSLGSAVSRVFAQTEARLALNGRSQPKLAQLVAGLRLPEERALIVADDITAAQGVERLVDAVRVRWGGIDALLNAAGGWSGGKPVWETRVKAWDGMMSLNLRAAFLLSQAVLPSMLDKGWGRVVHVSSKTALEPRAKRAAYAVSKMGVITLTEVIAAEVKGSGVTANVILPSVIDTPANRQAMPKADTSKWVPPEQIAQTMRFLCSSDAASINGAQIAIYGAV